MVGYRNCFAVCIALLMIGISAKGQLLKMHFPTINPNEIGGGLAYQHDLNDKLSMQVSVDALYPMRVAIFFGDFADLSGLGVRVNPEVRTYVKRKQGRNLISLFLGGGPMFKAMRVNERIWGGPEYEKYAPFEPGQEPKLVYRNRSYGLMGRVGLEIDIGKAKRWMIEGSWGFGLTYNDVRIDRDQAFLRRGFFYFEDISVSNRNAGLLPYMDLRAAIGYRLR